MAVLFKLITALPFIFFIPGYFAFLCLKLDGPGEKKLCFSETVFVQVLISVLLSSFTGVALALLGCFSIVILTVVLAALSAVLAAFSGSRIGLQPFSRPKLNAATALMAGILILSAVLFSRPFEFIVGGWDPGAYVNTGVNIARTGSFVIHDDFLKEMSPEDQRVFSHYRNKLVEKYPGFTITDPGSGKIVPHFYILYPVWTGIFHSLAGMKLALYVNTVFGIMAVFSIYLVGKTLFHRNAGIIAAFLLAVNIAQAWQARFPTTEIVTQFLIFSGIYMLAVFTSGGRRGFGIIAATCLGLAFFARIDTVLLLPSVFLFFYYRSLSRSIREDIPFTLPLASILLLASVYYLTTARTAARVVTGGFHFVDRNILVIALTIAIAVLVIARIFSSRTAGVLRSALSSRVFKLLVMAVVTGLVIYAYFIRPKMVETNDAANLVALGWFLSPFGLLMATVGLLWLTFSGLDDKTAPFFLIALTFSAFLIYRKMINPSYMWAVRRYVPVVIPSSIILTGFLIHKISTLSGRVATAISYVLVAVVAAHSAVKGTHLFLHNEYEGTVGFCEAFAENFDEDDVIVCDGYWLAMPLHYIHGLNTLQVSDQHSPKAIAKCRRAAELMAGWVDQGRDVYYVTHRERIFTMPLDFVHVDIPADVARFEKKVLERSKEGLPKETKVNTLTLKIFKAGKPGTARLNTKDWYIIDIGRNSFGLLEGFYQRERYRLPGGKTLTFRWTKGDATDETSNGQREHPQAKGKIVIPWFGDEIPTKITLHMTPGRTEDVSVSINVDGQAVKDITLSGSSFFRE